ncbi:MAG: E3 binding domain-containing protein, partial [Bdellovibrionales bacterium]|nr:E3 binding domain-containing protein [Bdellovibrionales bacterium]
MAFEFKLPDIGEGVSEGEIVQWLVAPGEKVEEDQAIVELMTDKATVEIASPKQGTIEKLFGDAGQSIAVGSPLASIAVSQESSSDQAHEKNEETFTKKEAKQDQKEASQTQDTSSSLNGTGDPSLVLASPATRKLAREKGIDLYEVKGTGDHGRVTLEDVKSFTGTSPSAKPALT